MPYDKFYIGPFDAQSGLQTNMQPWQIPDTAYAELNNAYVWRGRVRKRFGSTYMINDQKDSRLRIQIGTVAAPVSPVPGALGAVGQIFSIEDTILTVVIPGPGAQIMNTTLPATGDFDTTTGVVNFFNTGTYNPLSPIYWYPSLPVMGITQYEIGTLNNHPTYAFDTSFAYEFIPGSGFSRLGTAQWNGSDTDFFWSITWQGLTDNLRVLFTTNFHATLGAPALTDDPIRFWDGAAWNDFTPQFLNDGSFVATARIILAFKDRLILLNTIEQNAAGQNQAFVNRCRYSQNGSPLQEAVVPDAPFYSPSWLESTQTDSQGAGFVDATTEEAIVSAEFIKDRLIVYFERSTWELAYTGNEILPFVWQKINTELGSQSTLSSVPFDKIILTVGSTGVNACSGANVERIDAVIPDEVFRILGNLNAENRVAGIRDYFTEMVYWTMPTTSPDTSGNFPNQILVYNYKTGTWALNDDCITAFGYFDQQDDNTWADIDEAWQECNFTWTSGVERNEFRRIVAGNQEGFVYRIDPDISSNEHVMQITDMDIQANHIDFTIINHSFAVGDYFHVKTVEEFIGITDANGDFNGVVPSLAFGAQGTYFIIGDSIFTVTVSGGVPLPLTVNGTGAGTFDGGTTTLNIIGATPFTDIILSVLPPAFITEPGVTNINRIFQVDLIIDVDTIRVINLSAAGFGFMSFQGYRGGLTVSRVSNIQILTKQWNFYNQDDMNISIQKVDFNVTKTELGQITVDYLPSSSEISMIEEAQATNSQLGTNVLETSPYALVPLEDLQERLWHPVYFQTNAQTIQLFFYFSDEQITDPDIAFSDFELNGLIIYASRAGRMQ